MKKAGEAAQQKYHQVTRDSNMSTQGAGGMTQQNKTTETTTQGECYEPSEQVNRWI